MNPPEDSAPPTFQPEFRLSGGLVLRLPWDERTKRLTTESMAVLEGADALNDWESFARCFSRLAVAAMGYAGYATALELPPFDPRISSEGDPNVGVFAYLMTLGDAVQIFTTLQGLSEGQSPNRMQGAYARWSERIPQRVWPALAKTPLVAFLTLTGAEAALKRIAEELR